MSHSELFSRLREALKDILEVTSKEEAQEMRDHIAALPDTEENKVSALKALDALMESWDV